LSGRHCTRLWVVASLVCLCVGFAFAAEGDLTAAELFDQGLAHYQQGEYDAARVLLRRVDPMQLARGQRVLLYHTLQELDQKTQVENNPAAALQQADQLRREGRLAEALTLYRQVLDRAVGSAELTQTAQARIAETRRALLPDLDAARAVIAEAEQDIEADRLDVAATKLEAVRASNLDLGWFDAQRVERLLMLVAEQQQQARTATAVTTAQPAEDVQVTVKATVTVEDDTAPEPIVFEAPVTLALSADDQPTQPAPTATAAAPAAPAPAPVMAEEEQEAPQDIAQALEPAEPVVAAAPVAAAPVAAAPAAAAPVAAAPTSPPPTANDKDLLAQMRQLYAQQKVAEAAAAERDGQYRLAAKLYSEAIALDPNNAQAKAGQMSAEAKVNQQTGPQALLTQHTESRQLAAEMTVAEFEQFMNEANQLATMRNFAAASERIAQAKVLLDRNQQLLPLSEYKQLRDRAVLRAAEIADQAQLAEAEDRQELIEQRQRDSEARRRAALEQTEREVQRLLFRAAELRREFKYDESLQVLDQALFLDPNNPATQLMKEMIEDSQLYVRYRTAVREQDLKIAEMRVENLEATRVQTDLVKYPTDWPELTARRLGALQGGGQESEINRRVAATLKQSVPVNFDATRLDNVIDFIRDATGLKFFVNWLALEEVGVEPDMPISLQLDNVPADLALRLILEQASAFSPLDPVTFSVVEGIVTIATQSNLTRATEIRVYDIRDLLVQVPHFTDAPEFDLDSVLSGDEGLSLTEADTTDTEVTRPELVLQITTLIQDTIGRQDEWQLYGGDQSSLQELNGNLIVKTTPQNHRQLMNLLGQFRESRSLQIHVEGRFLLVDHNFLEEVGLDIDIAYDLADPWGGITIDQDSFGISANTEVGTTGMGGSFSGSPTLSRSMEIAFSYIDDLQLDVLIKATQANRRAVSLTAPRITFFNGQRAYVLVASQVAFVSDLEPIPDTLGFDPTPSILSAGVVLDVEGTVSADRRYVTLTLRPSLATNKGFRLFPVVNNITNVDGNVIGTSSANIEQPQLEITTIRTTVTVPDRGTLLLGGQRLVADIELEAGVPVLSKIPILNRFFTNETMVKDERSLLILIKPTIILQNEMEEQLYPGLLSDPQQFNLGQTF